jgi:hypothetical protein
MKSNYTVVTAESTVHGQWVRVSLNDPKFHKMAQGEILEFVQRRINKLHQDDITSNAAQAEANIELEPESDNEDSQAEGDDGDGSEQSEEEDETSGNGAQRSTQQGISSTSRVERVAEMSSTTTGGAGLQFSSANANAPSSLALTTSLAATTTPHEGQPPPTKLPSTTMHALMDFGGRLKRQS